MRFLVDVQLPPALAEWLKAKGHEAEHVLERLGADQSDHSLAGISRETGVIVVSKDADFLNLQIGGKPQVLWVRLGNSTNRTLLSRFEEEWPRLLDALSCDEPVVELD